MIRLLFFAIVFLPFLGNAQISDPNFDGWEGNPWGRRFFTMKMLYAATEPPNYLKFDFKRKLTTQHKGWQTTFIFKNEKLKEVELTRYFHTSAINEGFELFQSLRQELDSLFPDQPIIGSIWQQYRKNVIGEHSVISLIYGNTFTGDKPWALTIRYTEKMPLFDEKPKLGLPPDQ